MRPVDPAALITAALHTVEPAAQAKGISLVRSIAADVGPLRGDPSRLEQVVWNLVNNAVKFTPAGGRIEVKLSATEAGAQIVVADNGQGIAPDLLPHLFDRFRQGDATAARAGGLGIGLAIVKHLIEMHGGTVTAESPGAVSYTHLRAHETDSYLVCRLLLEKP